MTMTTREAFGGYLWPPQLLDYMMNRLLTGAPFSESLTQFPTRSGKVVFPTTAPEAGTWLAEGEVIPGVQLNPEADVVAVCKLASLHFIGNESIADTLYPVAQEIGRKLAEADGPKLDAGLLYGQGQKEPVGVWDKAIEAEPAPSLRAAAIRAWSELLSAGASRSGVRVFAHPKRLGEEWSLVGNDGHALHGDVAGDGQLFLGPGIPVLPIPMLEEDHVLAADVTNVFFIVNERLTIESSEHGAGAWERDSRSLRVKLRSAIGAPLPAKSLRRVTIGSGTEPLAARAAAPKK